jgi:hypothetical protein
MVVTSHVSVTSYIYRSKYIKAEIMPFAEDGKEGSPGQEPPGKSSHRSGLPCARTWACVDGICPLRLLKETSKVCRDGMLEIDEGIDPSKLLLLSFSSFRLERFPITAGISPVKLFAYRKRVVRFVSWPIVAGISPDILLF